jgi:hypothetical protein
MLGSGAQAETIARGSNVRNGMFQPPSLMEASMRKRSFGHEAEKCRRQAEQFAGRPEALFLLRVARSFEELESGTRRGVQ